MLEAQAEASGVALLAVQDDGTVLALNERFCDLWGLDVAPKETTFTALLGALRRGDESAAALADLLSTSDPERRGELTTIDGRTIEWGTADDPDTHDRVWTFREVTRERNATRVLRDAENWLRMFAAHADGVVLELDTNMRVIGLWAQDATFFEKSEDELQGRPFTEALAEPQASFCESRIRSVVTTGRPESFEYVVERDGDQRVFAANAVLLPSHEGFSTSVTVLIRDVTERARLQRQVLEAERLAALGVLAAGVAHEINNPLGYMLLNLERVRRGLRNVALEELAQAVDMTIEGAERVQEIVQDLRRFSRSDDGEPRVPVDVRRVLGFALDMSAPALSPRARVEREFDDVPLVLATEGRLHQVFLNLILNAAQAIPEGASPASHRIAVTTSTTDDGSAVIVVRDTGVGIPDAHLRRIFEPFFTTKAPGVGTGLGLAICHGIVTSFGGKILVDSRLGHGSVFRVILPAASRNG
ncbi:Sensory box histidine kinase/response regulator [Labilithrix luteola]|uniref:histidine kinase n=1 Tax=Labilithrix luteola TaxID=1391654 RepID=A0A0K1Q8K5_9BACT|nr:Sensory box histidine kinase/response regulator [Labilithrix luteola]